uniref:intramembrane prenyl-peptidase Rce1 n=1 Tax=Blastobotrys adeninivorans TaxID=409370 RepID=A0A060TAD0_BLAAD
MIQSFVLTAAYVGVLYIRKETRPSSTVGRDDRNVVIERLVLVSVVTALACIWYWWHGYHLGLELSVENGVWAAKALGLTMILFAGPLFEALIVSPPSSYELKEEILSLFGVRNFVIGPVTEELVFRACLLASLEDSNWSFYKKVFLSPLFFGIAHLHHAYEQVLAQGTSQLAKIVVVALFQLTFTSIFGWYAAFLCLRTGTVYAPIIAHIFCNFMGVPSGSLGHGSRIDLIYRGLLVVGLCAFSYLITQF